MRRTEAGHRGRLRGTDGREKVTGDLTPGSVSLFTGKDLTGWKTHPSQPGHWRVENGVLIGSGAQVSHLYTERDDFKDFHLRVKARVNGRGSGGVCLRAPYDPVSNQGFLRGFGAQISSSQKLVHKVIPPVDTRRLLPRASPSERSLPINGSRWTSSLTATAWSSWSMVRSLHRNLTTSIFFHAGTSRSRRISPDAKVEFC